MAHLQAALQAEIAALKAELAAIRKEAQAIKSAPKPAATPVVPSPPWPMALPRVRYVCVSCTMWVRG